MNPSRILKTNYKGFCIGATVALGTTSMELLVNTLDLEPEKQARNLEGRTSIKMITLEETGPIAVKTYCRGGLISRLNQRHYVKWGKARPRKEMEFLFHGQNAGVKTPDPLAYITRGTLFYRAWLVTRAILPHRTFATLCLSSPRQAVALMPKISQNISKLVDAGIFHVDLHPGNFLITPGEKIHIVDFDKAVFYTGSRKELIKKYQKRWSRAVRKYCFPASICPLGLE